MVIDLTETNVYVACDNQNIYCYSLEVQQQTNQVQVENIGKNKQKRTLQHKKKVTALCLSVDGQHLISGDSQGLIYIWSTQTSETSQNQIQPSVNAPNGQGEGLISTYELHKDQGAITNLVPLHRPLSMFGLTANMKSYEVQDICLLQKHKNMVQDSKHVTIGLALKDQLEINQFNFSDKVGEAEEDDYFMNAA